MILANSEMLENKAHVVPRSWGGSCQTWELLGGDDLAVFHEEHAHGKARQFFFVLDGELSVRVLGRDQMLRRHEGLEIPPGEFHFLRGPISLLLRASEQIEGHEDLSMGHDEHGSVATRQAVAQYREYVPDTH